jgi:uncharacterized short protein YbdD (DUF466 family)
MGNDMQTTNPDYPPDYDEYLDDCYDMERGEAVKSYEEWRASRQTNGEHRGG